MVKTVYVCRKCGVVIQSEREETTCELCGGCMERYSPEKLICPYCKTKAYIEPAAEEMQLNSKNEGRMVARCRKCGASVSLHRETNIPMGRLGNKTLKEMRIQAHSLMDRIIEEKMLFEDPYYMTGNQRVELQQKEKEILYEEIGHVVHLSYPYCHFSCMDYYCLDSSIEYMKKYLRWLRMKRKNLNSMSRQIGKIVF